MSSDFERALERAAAENKARDAVLADQAREHAEMVKQAHAIIDPYLTQLGPKVVTTLRELGIHPIGLGRWDMKLPTTGCWEFEYYNDTDRGEGFVVIPTGEIGATYSSDKIVPCSMGWLQGGRIVWVEKDYGPTMFANKDDGKVYIHCGNSASDRHFQELSEYIAESIYQRKSAIDRALEIRNLSDAGRTT